MALAILRRSATRWGLCVALLATVGVIAAQASGSAAGKAGAPIKVGNITAIAGFGGIFVPFQVSLEAYIKWVNAHGGVSGRQIQLITQDDAGDPAKNAAAVRQFVDQNHVVALVGEATPGAPGGQAYLAQKGVPSLGGWSNDGSWQYANMFSIISSAYLPSKCAGYATVFAKTQGATDVAMIGLDYPGGHADITCYAAKAKSIGLHVAQAPVFASLTQADFRPILQSAMSAGAKDLIVDIGSDALIKVIQAGQQLGFKGRIFTTGSLTPSVISALGSLSKAVAGRIFGPAFAVYPSFPAKAVPGISAQTLVEVKNFQAAVPAKYQHDPFAMAGWASGVTLVDALKKVGPSSNALMGYMSHLKNYTAHGLLPPTTYTSVPHPPVRCVTWIEYASNGTFKAVVGNGYTPTCGSYINTR